MTPAAPPSAETVWLRMGYTLETTAPLNLGLNSETAIAARRPAPPPPTNRTSWFVTSNGNLSRRPANRSRSPDFGKNLRDSTRGASELSSSLCETDLVRVSENRFDLCVNGNVSHRKAVDEKAFAVRFAEMEEAADMVVLVVNAEKVLRFRVCQAESGQRGRPAESAADGPVFFHQPVQCHFFVRFLLAAGSGSGHGCSLIHAAGEPSDPDIGSGVPIRRV